MGFSKKQVFPGLQNRGSDFVMKKGRHCHVHDVYVFAGDEFTVIGYHLGVRIRLAGGGAGFLRFRRDRDQFRSLCPGNGAGVVTPPRPETDQAESNVLHVLIFLG